MRVPCHRLHDNSCLIELVDKLLQTVSNGFKFYTFIHFILPFFLKFKKIKKQPAKEARRSIKEFIYSLCMVTSTMAVTKSLLCQLKNVPSQYGIKYVFWGSFLGLPPSFLESQSRIALMGTTFLPRLIEAWIYQLRKYKYYDIKLWQIVTSYLFFYPSNFIEPCFRIISRNNQ